SNEVPKAQGGTYWCDDPNKFDDRDYVREHDSNDRRKRELLSEIAKALDRDPEQVLKMPAISASQFLDALEYGRIIHAEMSAICDAARLGRSLNGTVLYSTTFPCHMCAKHVVAAGIAKVVFLEPYPKSLTATLHGDSIRIEGADRGRHQIYPAVEFTHFHGVTHRRYRELFERGRRKDANGTFVEWSNALDDGIKTYPRPIMDLKFPFYLQLEKTIIEAYANFLKPPVEAIGAKHSGSAK
ncbi:MAG TPA: deaminase, partial [Candidatus Binataceae bacterium]|nr:deaminase [Candidatus Binataceae bacterium]